MSEKTHPVLKESSCRILWIISENSDISLAEIVKKTDYDHAWVSRQVAQMVKLGLIDKRIEGRTHHHTLTENGENYIPVIPEDWREDLDIDAEVFQ